MGNPGLGMKRYRPHILVSCVLAIVLLTGVHKVLQNALTDMRFGWFPRAGQRRHRPGGDRPAVDRQDRRLALAPAEACGADRQAGKRRRQRHRLRRRFQLAVERRPPTRRFADALQRAGGSVVLPAFKQWADDRGNGRTIHVNRPLPQFEKHAWSAIVNVAVEPDGLVRRYSFGETLDGKFLPSVGRAAGRQATKRKAEPLRIDFSIRPESAADRSPLWMSCAAIPPLCKSSRARRSSSARRRSSSATDSACRTAASFRAPQLQMLAAELILQGRALRTVARRRDAGRAWLHPAPHAGAVAPLFRRRCGLWFWSAWPSSLNRAPCCCRRSSPSSSIRRSGMSPSRPISPPWRSTKSTSAACWAAIAEKRFQRIAMSLGDGLVCADQNGLITVWNPGRGGDFRLRARGNDRPAVRPHLRAAATRPGNSSRSRFANCRLKRFRRRAARSWSSRDAARTARHFRSKPASPNGRASMASSMAR